MKTTREIAEEGALEEAIKSINRKIQYRIGKIEGCKNSKDPESLLAKEIYEKELKELIRKRDSFNELWDKWYINITGKGALQFLFSFAQNLQVIL